MNALSAGTMAGLATSAPATMALKSRSIPQLMYGTAVAVGYSVIESRIPAATLLKGGILGLGVWSLARLGVIPRFRLPRMGSEVGLSPVMQDALAHMIWGASVSQAVRTIKSENPAFTERDPV